MKFKKLTVISMATALAMTSFSSLTSASEKSYERTNEDALEIRSDSFKLDGKVYDVDIKKEGNVKKATVVENGKEVSIVYDMDKGEIWVDGKLVANNVVNRYVEAPEGTPLTIDESETNSLSESDQITPLSISSPTFYIGPEGSGVYDYVSYREASVNIVGATSAIVAGAILVTWLESKPKQSAVLSTAAAVIGAFSTPNFTLYGNLYHYKDRYNSNYYRDSVNLYKGSISSSNHICQVVHYYGSL